jgi:hypothetical protein
VVGKGSNLPNPCANGHESGRGVGNRVDLPLWGGILLGNLLRSRIDGVIGQPMMAVENLTVAQSFDSFLLSRAMRWHPNHSGGIIVKSTNYGRPHS